jgi:hypothetical protein
MQISGIAALAARSSHPGNHRRAFRARCPLSISPLRPYTQEPCEDVFRPVSQRRPNPCLRTFLQSYHRSIRRSGRSSADEREDGQPFDPPSLQIEYFELKLFQCAALISASESGCRSGLHSESSRSASGHLQQPDCDHAFGRTASHRPGRPRRPMKQPLKPSPFRGRLAGCE